MAYTVTVDLSLKVKITTTCNCPYDWGGLCKHQVAVLMKYEEDEPELLANAEVEIADSDKNVGKLIKSLQLSDDFFDDDDDDDDEFFDEDEEEEEIGPVIIEKYQDISLMTIGKLSTSDDALYEAKFMIEKVEINDYDGASSIEFVIDVPGSYYSRDEFIVFSLTSDGLQAECTCGDGYLSFCSHMISVLLFVIVKREKPDFFKFLAKESRIEQMTSFAAKYGITGVKDIEQVLELNYDEHQLFYNFINKYEGLQPVDEKQLEHKKLFHQKNHENYFVLNSFCPGQ